jgi:hypothetical protein
MAADASLLGWTKLGAAVARVFFERFEFIVSQRTCSLSSVIRRNGKPSETGFWGPTYCPLSGVCALFLMERTFCNDMFVRWLER